MSKRFSLKNFKNCCIRLIFGIRKYIFKKFKETKWFYFEADNLKENIAGSFKVGILMFVIIQNS